MRQHSLKWSCLDLLSWPPTISFKNKNQVRKKELSAEFRYLRKPSFSSMLMMCFLVPTPLPTSSVLLPMFCVPHCISYITLWIHFSFWTVHHLSLLIQIVLYYFFHMRVKAWAHHLWTFLGPEQSDPISHATFPRLHLN